MSVLRFVSRVTAAAVATAVLALAPCLAVAADTVPAVWVPKHIQFIYQGFTTRYSCDGLQEEVRSMLQKLGPEDLHVRQLACPTPTGVPSPFPGVQVRMRVLVPASSAEASKYKGSGPVVQAHWQKVVLMPSNADIQEQGNCELIEQFKESLLPLFTTRKVDYGSTCVPYQLTLGTHLSAEVLMPPGKH